MVLPGDNPYATVQPVLRSVEDARDASQRKLVDVRRYPLIVLG